MLSLSQLHLQVVNFPPDSPVGEHVALPEVHADCQSLSCHAGSLATHTSKEPSLGSLCSVAVTLPPVSSNFVQAFVVSMLMSFAVLTVEVLVAVEKVTISVMDSVGTVVTVAVILAVGPAPILTSSDT